MLLAIEGSIDRSIEWIESKCVLYFLGIFLLPRWGNRRSVSIFLLFLLQTIKKREFYAACLFLRQLGLGNRNRNGWMAGSTQQMAPSPRFRLCHYSTLYYTYYIVRARSLRPFSTIQASVSLRWLLRQPTSLITVSLFVRSRRVPLVCLSITSWIEAVSSFMIQIL